MPVELTLVTPSPAHGYYADMHDLEVFFGADNVRIWSQKGKDDDADLDAVQAALDSADATIDGVFRPSTYEVPLRQTNGEPPSIAKHWATVIAAHDLYNSRSLRGTVPNQRGVPNASRGASNSVVTTLFKLRETVERDMALYASGVRQIDAVCHEGVPRGISVYVG